MSDYPNRVSVLGVPIDPWTMEQTVQRIEDYATSRQFAHFIGVNADKVLQMHDDADMNDMVRRCEVINADGASMTLAAKCLGVYLPERVAGIDLMDEACKMAAKRGLGVYLLGARPEVVADTARALFTKYPELPIVGYRDGYFSDEELAGIAQDIENCNASIVFVGITSPKKERVIETLRGLGSGCVFLGVGGSFDVISGHIKRAPMWMQRANIEWLFRMAQEPTRLAKRYLVGNARFAGLLLMELGKGRARA